MAEQKFYNLNVTDFVNGIIQQANMTRDSIKNDVVNYINTSQLFKSKIYSALARRLKISTGELASSIRFTAYTIDDDKEHTGKFDIRGNKLYSFTSIITVKITVANKLLPALLSGDELSADKNSRNIPEIPELIAWIRGKNKYFAHSVERLDSLREVALRKQREAMLRNKNGINKYKVSQYIVPRYEKDREAPITTLANTIRSRMIKRVANGLPATKGSQFIFLGIYTSTENSTKKQKDNGVFLIPKYRKVEGGQPLLTQDRKLKKQGEINEIVFDVIDNLIKKNLKNIVEKFQKSSPLGDQLMASEKKGRTYMFDELNSSFNYFQDIIESIGDTNTVGSRKYYKKAMVLHDETESAAYSYIITAKKYNGRKMNEIAKDLIAMKKFKGGYKRGRRAKRRNR